MPVVMQNAASMAYRKAVQKTRESLMDPDMPAWLVHFGDSLPEDDSKAAPNEIYEETRHRKIRLLQQSKHPYARFSWKVYDNITSKMWFEVFILINIIAVGIMTGVDLEMSENRDPVFDRMSTYVSRVTLVVFFLEVVLKLLAEGFEPWHYFIDREDGYFNTFDFVVVACSFAFLNDDNGQTISFLRMLRLLRLLTFVKGVPQLRIIVAGLVQGVKSVIYIVLLLFLVIYMYAILGCILFGENDPAHFGTVSIAMVSLFQVSTLASWTNIAYVSWFGCEHFLESPYSSSNPSTISTDTGSFEGFKCDRTTGMAMWTGAFFTSYILLTSFVIMSLFVGVISMGMFQSFLTFKKEDEFISYINKLDENSMYEHEMKHEKHHLTLKDKIDIVLADEIPHKYRPSKLKRGFHEVVGHVKKVRDSDMFSILITCTILLVGVVIGLDTNASLKCMRLENRIEDRDDDNDGYRHKALHRCDDAPNMFSVTVSWVAQGIFTFEFMIKVLAEGTHPTRYFTDREQGSWNCLDFFIVLVGFMELTPARFIFKDFPVVLLRLLRLLRVFRLAKALPRLRSIVEALISGFSSVGWICLLIAVFNYIVACMFMLLFKENDPFHFGSVGQAMFTVLRIETLDTWDQILYIGMFGCEGYPNGYEMLTGEAGLSCEKSHAFGWLATIVFTVVTIIGAFVMPTVLIGVVSIKFDETTSKFQLSKAKKKEYNIHLAHAQEKMPDFFTAERVEAITDVFETLASGGQLALDLSEISLYFHYSIDKLFGVEMKQQHCEALFYLLDTSKNTEIGLGEFLTFNLILREMYVESRLNKNFAFKIFGQEIKAHEKNEKINSSSMEEEKGEMSTSLSKSAWDRAMDRVHKESYELTWEAILTSINGEVGDTLQERILNIFKEFDSDGTGMLDIDEMTIGLKSCGVPLNGPQMKFFFSQVDESSDGLIDIEEFMFHVKREVKKRMKRKDEELLNDMHSVLKRTEQLFEPDSNFLVDYFANNSHFDTSNRFANNNNATGYTSMKHKTASKDSVMNGPSSFLSFSERSASFFRSASFSNQQESSPSLKTKATNLPANDARFLRSYTSLDAPKTTEQEAIELREKIKSLEQHQADVARVLSKLKETAAKLPNPKQALNSINGSNDRDSFIDSPTDDLIFDISVVGSPVQSSRTSASSSSNGRGRSGGRIEVRPFESSPGRQTKSSSPSRGTTSPKKAPPTKGHRKLKKSSGAPSKQLSLGDLDISGKGITL